MNRRQALLRALIDEPDDDALRLIYADCLDEDGETEADRARAAFIRLQCEAFRLDEYDPHRLDLEGRAEPLLATHHEAWLAGLDRWSINYHPSNFERGFPCMISVQVRDILDRGHELWTFAPFNRLDIWDHHDSWDGRFPEFARCAHLSRFRELNLGGAPASAEELRPLLESPRVAGLTRLGFYPWVDQPWLSALIVSPLARTLSSLGLATFDPTGDLRRLTDSGLLGRLDNLSFHGRRPWTAEASQALAAGAGERLESFSWVADDLSGPALRAFLTAPPLRALHDLHIANIRFTPDNVSALADWLASDRLPRLRSLSLAYNSLLGAAGAATLASCPGLARLRELDLTGSGLNRGAGLALARSPYLGNLRVLRLGSNRIPGTALTVLADSLPKDLRVLELTGGGSAASTKALTRRFGPGVVR
jgi:uncharacterized protein (TIGR02996 family)